MKLVIYLLLYFFHYPSPQMTIGHCHLWIFISNLLLNLKIDKRTIEKKIIKKGQMDTEIKRKKEKQNSKTHLTNMRLALGLHWFPVIGCYHMGLAGTVSWNYKFITITIATWQYTKHFYIFYYSSSKILQVYFKRLSPFYIINTL